jgi:site-specific recombinase XerC
MGRKRRAKAGCRRNVLRLPDLDHSKSAVLNSLASPGSRRAYQFAIEEFTAWYCSEPRLAFNRIVLVRYRMHLEARSLSAATINQRLAAVPRLAYEAVDCGLLSPELAAGIRRVKGVKQLGHRSGNWLSLDQSAALLNRIGDGGFRQKRDYAIVATLLGCGLRRSELVGLEVESIQLRQDHWVIVDLVVKVGTSAPCRFLGGPRQPWIAGSQQQESPAESCFGRSTGRVGCGVAASAKTSSGAL